MKLKKGDIIELKAGHTVYAQVPEHFVYQNRRGSFTLTQHDVTIGGEFSYLAGRYVVTHTSMDGGGTGHGPGDIYPDGHHVFCQRLDESGIEVDFYQSGCFTAMIADIAPVGIATMRWSEPG